jgi:hypothetical protein
MTSGSSIFRQIGFGAIVLLVAAVLIGVVLNWQANHRLDSKLAILRAAGEPTSLAELAPKPIPPEQNSAAILRGIATDLETFGNEMSAFYDSDLGKGFDSSLDHWQPPTAEQLDAMGNILNRHPEILAALEQAARCDRYASLLNYKVPHSAFMATEIEHVQKFRDLARFVDWNMMVLASQGKRDQAIQSAIDMLKVTQQIESECGMVSYLVAIACRGIANQRVNEILRAGPISADTHTKLEQALAKLDGSPRLSPALKVERAMGMSATDEISSRSPMFKILAWKMKGWQCDVLDFYENVLTFADHPWFEAQRDLSQANANLASLHPMVAQLAPAIRTFISASNRGLVEIRTLRILNAMEEFKQLNGHEAQSLAELKLRQAATIDPFSGRPLILKSTPTGWVIYSVAENGVDDGGDFKDLKDWGMAPVGSMRRENAETEQDDSAKSPSAGGNAVEPGGG